jgi:asparagine synthase (glutamine-hydrolysing)
MKDWCVAWGASGSELDRAVWLDQGFAVFSEAEIPFVISPSDRFVVVGDVDLSDRLDLRKRLGIDPQVRQSDLDVIALLWERWQTEALTMLVGVFALVVWDRERQQLWMGRDRVGGRTLYYTVEGTTRWIAPKLQTLSLRRSSEIDLIALRDYLCCAFVPGARTLWRDVRELRPGTALGLPEGQQVYWQVTEEITAADQPLVWHGERLRSLLQQVVKEALPDGEPVGVFLSGGLDSSCITALVSELHDRPVHTYSIHFGTDCPNELEFSSQVAGHCQTQHHILEITFREMWARLPETMAALDDPIGDPLTVPNLLLGRLARESVGVVLNGEGGDPCFGGPKNQPMLLRSLYESVVSQAPLEAYLASFQKCATDLKDLLKPEVWQAVQQPSVFEEDLHSRMDYLNRLMALNIKFKGADQILTKVNNLMSAAKLQGRSPLFDQRIVAMSLEIPPQYKLSGVQEKAVLKQAVADLLPDRIINRPKSGMMVPVQKGFREHWQWQARWLLLNKRAAIAPYINQAIVREWLSFRGDVWGRYGVKLWLLVSLELWLQANQNSPRHRIPFLNRRQ